jgi:hypothetical protein
MHAFLHWYREHPNQMKCYNARQVHWPNLKCKLIAIFAVSTIDAFNRLCKIQYKT